MFRDVDREAGVTNVGHIFLGEDLLRERMTDELHESPNGMTWTIVNTDYENELVMSACVEQKVERNAQGFTYDEVKAGRYKLRRIDFNAHAVSDIVKKLRVKGTSPKFTEAIELMKSSEEPTEILRLKDACEGKKELTDLVEDIEKLLEAEKRTWKEIREMFLMPMKQLDVLVKEMKDKTGDVGEELDRRLYTDVFDNNFQPAETIHDHMLNLFVTDLTQYEEEKAFE